MSVFTHCSVPEIITTLAQTFDQLIAAQKCQDNMEYFALLPLVPVQVSKCYTPTLFAVWHTLTQNQNPCCSWLAAGEHAAHQSHDGFEPPSPAISHGLWTQPQHMDQRHQQHHAQAQQG
jgi:hypothetical protein